MLATPGPKLIHCDYTASSREVSVTDSRIMQASASLLQSSKWKNIVGLRLVSLILVVKVVLLRFLMYGSILMSCACSV